MNCNHARELWDRYRDGDLAGPEAQELENHLADCDGCERLWRKESGWLAVLGDATPISTEQESREFTGRVLRALRVAESRPNVFGRIGRYVAAAAVVAVMVTLALSQFWSGSGGVVNGTRESVVSQPSSSDGVLFAQATAPVSAVRDALEGASQLLDVDRYTNDLADFLDATTGADGPKD